MSSTFGPTYRDYSNCEIAEVLDFQTRVLVLDVSRYTGLDWRTVARVVDSLRGLGFQLP